MREALISLQQRIDAWCREVFPEQTELTILEHLREEVLELHERGTAEEAADCLILLLAWAAHTQQPLIATVRPERLLDDLLRSLDELIICAEWNQPATGEVGEATVFLTMLLAWATMSGENLLAAAEAKHAVNLARQWRRGPDGIHHHVEADSEAAE